MMFHLFKGGVKLANTTKSAQKWLFHRNNVQLAKQLGVHIALASVLLGAVPVSASTLSGKTPELIAYDANASDLQFATNSSALVELTDLQVIEPKIGASKFETTKKKEQLALSTTTRTRSSRVADVSADPGATAKRALAQAAADTYGVPWEIVEAVWQVESGKSWDTGVRSYAGAQGPAQFMPATWRHYGVDADGDGVKNIHDAQDAVYGAARYLAANGADRGKIHKALFAYNHAEWYVNKVLRVARGIGYTG